MSTKLSGKALVIQLTRDNIRIAKMQRGAKVQIICCTKLTTPAGAVEDGSLLDIAALAAVIKPTLAEPDFKGIRRVVFSLCTTQAISEKVKVPAAGGQKLNKIIDANLDMYFPVEVSDYHITRLELGRGRGDNRSKNIIMQLWAIPKAVLAPYYTLASACGLNVIAIDYCGHSHARISGATFMEPRPVKARKKQADGSEHNDNDSLLTSTIIHLMAEPEMMVMTFVRDGRVQMQRSFLHGSDIDNALGEVMMVIDYYRSFHDDRDAPMELVICGSLSEEPSFIERAEKALLIPTHIHEADHGSGWCCCIGAAQSELDFGSVELAGKKDRKKGLSAVWHYAVMLAGGTAAVSSILLLTVSKTDWNTELTALRATEATLSLQVSDSHKAAEEYSRYTEIYQNFSSDWSRIFSSLRTYNDNMVLILQELETLMPSETFVESIDIQPNGVSLHFSCPDKEDAAYLIMALREMEYATLDSVSNLSGTTGKVGRTNVEPPPDEGSGMMGMMQDAIDSGLMTEAEALDIYLNLSEDERDKLAAGNLSQSEMSEIFADLDKEQQDKLSSIYTEDENLTDAPNSPNSDGSVDLDSISNGSERPPEFTWDDLPDIPEQETDKRIHFSVFLAYNESLISAELERKGFVRAEIPAMLEVE